MSHPRSTSAEAHLPLPPFSVLVSSMHDATRGVSAGPEPHGARHDPSLRSMPHPSSPPASASPRSSQSKTEPRLRHTGEQTTDVNGCMPAGHVHAVHEAYIQRRLVQVASEEGLTSGEAEYEISAHKTPRAHFWDARSSPPRAVHGPLTSYLPSADPVDNSGDEHEHDEGSSPSPKKRMQREAERKAALEADEYAMLVTATSVRCVGCLKEIKLDRRSRYYPGLWIKHRCICVGVQALKTAKALPPNQTAKAPPPNQMATAQPSPGTRDQTQEPEADRDVLARQALEYFSSWPKTYGSAGWMPCPVKRPGMTEWEKFKAEEKASF